jgi:DNA primase
LFENYETIIENGYVIVYEAEKSVLKRHSLHDGTGVAVCTHSITNKQAEILISLNVDIIIAWDKDIGDNDIFKACKKFKGIRNVYYIKDTFNILGEKDSPADASNENFELLLKNKIKY